VLVKVAVNEVEENILFFGKKNLERQAAGTVSLPYHVMLNFF